MRTLVCDPPPADIEALLERRKKLGQDRHDEVWEGVVHIVPSPSYRHSVLGVRVKRLLGPAADAAGLELSDEFNLGDSREDFRVPDGGLHRPGAAEMWLPTAALAIEILSPGDETWEKLSFYAAHHVDELLIVDPDTRKVHWLALTGASPDGEDKYEPTQRSGLIDLGPEELAQQIDWP